MPIYEYICPAEHVTDYYHRFSSGERPAVVPCEKCGDMACYRPARPASTMGAKPEPPPIKEPEGTGLTNHGYVCGSCAHGFDEINDWDKGERPHDPRPCPKCGSESRYIPGANVAEWTVKTYGAQGGYYDRGLGRFFSSPAEKAEYLKKHNLVQYDDSSDDWMDRRFAEHDAGVRREEEELKKYHDALDNAPGFAPLRKAMDQGRI